MRILTEKKSLDRDKLIVYYEFIMKKTDLTEVYKKYKGLWVALDEKLGKVISSDKSAKTAYTKAVQNGHKKPTLFKVPQKNIFILA